MNLRIDVISGRGHLLLHVVDHAFQQCIIDVECAVRRADRIIHLLIFRIIIHPAIIAILDKLLLCGAVRLRHGLILRFRVNAILGHILLVTILVRLGILVPEIEGCLVFILTICADDIALLIHLLQLEVTIGLLQHHGRIPVERFVLDVVVAVVAIDVDRECKCCPRRLILRQALRQQRVKVAVRLIPRAFRRIQLIVHIVADGQMVTLRFPFTSNIILELFEFRRITCLQIQNILIKIIVVGWGVEGDFA